MAPLFISLIFQQVLWQILCNSTALLGAKTINEEPADEGHVFKHSSKGNKTTHLPPDKSTDMIGEEDWFGHTGDSDKCSKNDFLTKILFFLCMVLNDRCLLDAKSHT